MSARTVMLLLPLALLCAGTLAAQERFTLRGDDVAVYNLAGEVRVVAGTGPDVTVEVRRGGAAAARLRIETGQVGGRETLRVVYPGDRVVYPAMGRGSNTNLRVARDGTFGGRALLGRQVRIHGAGSGDEVHADLVIRVPRGRTIAVHHVAGAVSVEGVDADLLVDTHSASVSARDTRGRLKADVGSGAVRIAGAEGEVIVDGGSSSVHVERVRGTNLHIDTGSGAVTGDDIQVERLLVDTGSGRVRLGRVAVGEGRVDTGSGGVEVALVRPVRSLVIDTGSGGVRLSVPTGFGAELYVDTGSGGIQLDVPVAASQRSRTRFVGQIGDGGGSIRIDTGSGGVRVVGG